LRREKHVQADLVKEAIGIALADGRYMRIIDKDSKLPITRRVMIPTVRDNQRTLEVDLFEGDSDDIIEADYLGTLVYTNIAEAKAGEAKVIVDMSLGVDRVLTLSSPETGRENETFEFKTKGHRSRKDKRAPAKSVFAVAKGVPAPAE
jgi:molecular chaperone DnaK (HSP70)